MKPLLLCLFAAWAVPGSIPAARACQYCALAANDPEMAKLAAEMHAKTGGFPLDGAINQFQAVASAATLTTPPPMASVTTRAADLPTTSLPATVLHRVPPPPAAKSARVAPTTATVPSAASAATSSVNRWANGGLLGLCGLLGFFGWRTRRPAGSAS